MARTPESAAVDFAESSLFTGRFSILALQPAEWASA